jgi:ribonucleoside-diphosphate reductase beta chain
MINSYDHFVLLAESLQWDEAEIDFSLDKKGWPTLGEPERARVLGLIAGFCIAESAVSVHIDAFEAAAGNQWMAAAFRAQSRDEHRHARFFDRVAAEVAAIPGDGVAARLDCLRALVSPELVALFEERLPATALSLAEGREDLITAVGLYHMVLEGVVLLAGQNALLDALGQLSARLPGTRRGVELVLRDERWHMGFGTRLVQAAKLGRDEVAALLVLGQEAAGAWGDLIPPGAAERSVHIHQRRLRAADMRFW